MIDFILDKEVKERWLVNLNKWFMVVSLEILFWVEMKIKYRSKKLILIVFVFF